MPLTVETELNTFTDNYSATNNLPSQAPVTMHKSSNPCCYLLRSIYQTDKQQIIYLLAGNNVRSQLKTQLVPDHI